MAISQRHHTQHFAHLEKERHDLQGHLEDFFDDYIQTGFPDLSAYVFDVYIDKRNKVWLLDFNVWGDQTDGLLFAWEELHEMASNACVSRSSTNEEQRRTDTVIDTIVTMRIVENDREIHHDPLASYRAPIDTVDLATMSGLDATNFEEFMALCQKPSELEATDQDNDDDDGDEDKAENNTKE